MAILILYEKSRRTKDLDEGITYHREALTLQFCPIGCPSRSTVDNALSLHPDCPTSLSNLANALLARYEQPVSLKDLEEAITYNREALTLHPPKSFHFTQVAWRILMR